MAENVKCGYRTPSPLLLQCSTKVNRGFLCSVPMSGTVATP